MVLRILLVALLTVGLAAAAIVFESASTTALALDLAQSARNNDSSEVRARLLDRAEAALRGSWARPTLWHAGAAEALSGVYFFKAEADTEPRFYTLSAEWAERAVRLAPVQPHAWTRLALLAQLGYPNPVCEVSQCLERAFAAAPMIDAETACLRLQIAHRQGLLAPDDARVDAYLRSGVSRREAARCLSFMAPEELFNALMRAARA